MCQSGSSMVHTRSNTRPLNSTAAIPTNIYGHTIIIRSKTHTSSLASFINAISPRLSLNGLEPPPSPSTFATPADTTSIFVEPLCVLPPTGLASHSLPALVLHEQRSQNQYAAPITLSISGDHVGLCGPAGLQQHRWHTGTVCRTAQLVLYPCGTLEAGKHCLPQLIWML